MLLTHGEVLSRESTELLVLKHTRYRTQI